MRKCDESSLCVGRLYLKLEEVMSMQFGSTAPILISVNSDVCKLDQSTIKVHMIKDYNQVDQVIISINTNENEEMKK